MVMVRLALITIIIKGEYIKSLYFKIYYFFVCRHKCLKEIELKRDCSSILLDNLRFRYNGEDDEDSEDCEGSFLYPLVSLINF